MFSLPNFILKPRVLLKMCLPHFSTFTKGHQKSHLAVAFFKEALQECKDIFDDEALTDLIKVMNIIKNEKLAAAKRKVKGQAQKVKRDKVSELKAKQLQAELYGDGDVLLDQYDKYGEQYEDDFF
jgi:hypothetical protein